MQQFHVLIVDDEIYSIRGVQAGVCWEKLNIKVFIALNLKQAQQVFLNNRIDLLICDIEMPKGSGIDLVKWVREYYTDTETIFLTCHSDFSYAQEAIQLQSLNYLLKPVDYQELEGAIYDALEKINRNHQTKKIEMSYLSLRKTHDEVMQERFWFDLISGAISSTGEEIVKNMVYYHLHYPKSTIFLPILIHVQRWNKPLPSEKEKLMDFALQNVAMEVIVQDKSSQVITLETGYVLVLLDSFSPINKKEVSNFCKEFVSYFTKYFFCNICCYLGNLVAIHEVQGMVKGLLELDRNNVTISNEVVIYRERRKKEVTIRPFPSQEWTNLMRLGERKKLVFALEEYFNNWRKQDSNITAQSLHLLYQDFLQFIFYNLQVKGIHANEVYSQNLLTERPKKVLNSLNSLQDWLIYVTEVALNKLYPVQEKESVVEVVKQYISENIGERKLTREDIASYVYLNPDYLSRLFKREMGLSISAYMQKARIEYATKLLEETDLSVSEIALSAGYANFSYFSTAFKKVTNYNPAEYRKKIKRSENEK